MNKLFTRIAIATAGIAMAISVGSFGSRVVREARADSASLTFTSASAVTVDGITATPAIATGSNAPIFSSPNLRLYANNTLTVSSTVGKMTAISMTWTKNGSKTFATVTTNVGSYTHASSSGGTGSWTGNADSVVFSIGSSGQIQTTTISVTYTPDDPGVTYTISYNANGGTGSMESTTGANPAVAQCGFTAPTGKVFSTWNTAANGSGTSYAPNATPGKNLSLYAIWIDAPSEVKLQNIGDGLPSAASAEIGTTDVQDAYTSDEYTLNYYQCKLQTKDTSKAIFMTKSVNPFISNHTEIPGEIESVEVFILTGAAKATTYDVAFGTSEFTTATSGVGAVNITGGNSHVFESNVSGATYFCITLGNDNNGQVVDIVITYSSEDPSAPALELSLNNAGPVPSSLNYNSSSYLIYANSGEEEQLDVDWSVSDNTVLSISENGNHVGVLTTLKPGTSTLSISKEGYKSASVSITVNAGTLSTLVVSGSMTKTSYYVGESWNPAGLTVSGTYSTGYHGDVTNLVAWSYNPASPALNVESVVATATLSAVNASSAAQAVTVTRTNPIQVLYTKASGASVDVYGYYVGFLDGTGPVIMDGDYGIVVYNKSADVSGYTENETILHVTGSISIYNGLYEIGSSSISVASGTYDVPNAPVVYAAKGGETADYASRTTTVTGTAVVTSGSFDDAAGTNDIKMNFTVGSNTIQVFYKKAAQTADATAFAAIKDAVANSTEVTIKGFTGWFNGFQVQMNGVVEAVVGYTAEDFAQDLLDQTDAVCEGYDGKANNKAALVTIWSDLASADKYPSLPFDQKEILANAERKESGTVVEQAMARYDYLTGKYDLSNFINGRTPMANVTEIAFENTNMTFILIASITSLVAFATILVIRKKKQAR